MSGDVQYWKEHAPGLLRWFEASDHSLEDIHAVSMDAAFRFDGVDAGGYKCFSPMHKYAVTVNFLDGDIAQKIFTSQELREWKAA